MPDGEVVLHPGTSDESGWMPRVTLEHDAQRAEMFVIVSEEAAGMIEGIGLTQFEEIAERLANV